MLIRIDREFCVPRRLAADAALTPPYSITEFSFVYFQTIVGVVYFANKFIIQEEYKKVFVCSTQKNMYVFRTVLCKIQAISFSVT